MKNELLVISGAVLDDRMRFTLVELCECARVSEDAVRAMVEEGILEPEGDSMQQWLFDSKSLNRLQVALRLERDLGVNLAGSAVILNLLEELNAMRHQLGIR